MAGKPSTDLLEAAALKFDNNFQLLIQMNKSLLALAFIILATFALQAQNVQSQRTLKETDKAKIVNTHGQERLVLLTGRQSSQFSSYPVNIEIVLTNKTWRMLDSLITSPWGSSVNHVDAYGYGVFIQKARVNEHEGLIFSSGSKCVAIKKEELYQLK